MIAGLLIYGNYSIQTQDKTEEENLAFVLFEKPVDENSINYYVDLCEVYFRRYAKDNGEGISLYAEWFDEDSEYHRIAKKTKKHMVLFMQIIEDELNPKHFTY